MHAERRHRAQCPSSLLEMPSQDSENQRTIARNMTLPKAPRLSSGRRPVYPNILRLNQTPSLLPTERLWTVPFSVAGNIGLPTAGAILALTHAVLKWRLELRSELLAVE
jgi:hypothetical protein